MDRTQEELLRKLRGRLAFKGMVEPYVIFNDESLGLVLEVQPKTIEELGGIKGFPADGKRVAKWGQAIIDIFNQTDKVLDFSVDVDKDGDLVVVSELKPMKLFGV